MACPYFYPTERLELGWSGRGARLPLGDPYRGLCHADPGDPQPPGDGLLEECCNLGYARHACARFPAGEGADAVRFSLTADQDNIITIYFALERGHQPDRHGRLEYDGGARAFRPPPADPLLRRQAEAYVESYLRRRRLP